LDRNRANEGKHNREKRNGNKAKYRRDSEELKIQKETQYLKFLRDEHEDGGIMERDAV
jgi:hypothetical protein